MLLPALLCLTLVDPSAPADDAQHPRELGLVAWRRTLEPALEESAASGRPLLLLFQEIPGCQGCVDFGSHPLSHPLLVEAIETAFVPVAIHNNRPGYDETIRARFDEPAWNFPVMRFLDGTGRDLLPRRDRIFETGAVADRLIEALGAANRPVPAYLRLAAAEQRATDRATFAMHCFWEGESALGELDGVVDTTAGWVDGREVVEVRFDPGRMAYRDLVTEARCRNAAQHVYAHGDDQWLVARELAGDGATRRDGAAKRADESDQTHALARSELRLLPLTPMQATKINAALAAGDDPTRWLSPRQVDLLERIRSASPEAGPALAGLTRPDSIERLALYEQTLRERLDAIEGAAGRSGS